MAKSGKKTSDNAVPVQDDTLLTHNQDPLITLTEAGVMVGRSRSTISRWVEDGLLRSVRDPNNARRIRRSELVRFYGATALAESRPLPEEE